MLNSTNDTVKVDVLDSAEAKQEHTISINADRTNVGIVVEHISDVLPTQEESIGIQEQVIVNIVPSIPQLEDANTIRLSQGYNGLLKNSEPDKPYEKYAVGEFIELSDAVKNRLQTSNKNYPVYFTIEFDNIGQPLPLEISLYIPREIKELFGKNAFKIQSAQGDFAVRENELEENKVFYASVLSRFPLLNSII